LDSSDECHKTDMTTPLFVGVIYPMKFRECKGADFSQ
jgi:hypothetical protein